MVFPWNHSSMSLFLVLENPELDVAFQVWPFQCCIEGKDQPFWSSGSRFVTMAQNAPGSQCLLPGCIAGSCSAWPSGPFLSSCLPAKWSLFSVGQGVISHQVRTFPFLWSTSWDSCWPILQAVKVTLNCSMTTQCIKHSSQFYVICNLAEGAFYPISRYLMKYWPFPFTLHVTYPWTLQGWSTHNLPGQLFQCLTTLMIKNFFFKCVI